MYLESLLNRSFLLLFTLPQESSILYGKFYRKEGIRFMKISLFPTLKNYKKEYFGKDLTAGIMIAAVSIPISMGYAEVSGLPAVFGLYGSVLPILFFALFSTSPQFIFGVDAAPAAIAGAALASLGIESGSVDALRYMAAFILFFESRQARYIYFYSGYGRVYQRNRVDNYLDADSKDYGR